MLKAIFLVFISILIQACFVFEWQFSSKKIIFRPMSLFCYKTLDQTKCHPTASECVENQKKEIVQFNSFCVGVQLIK